MSMHVNIVARCDGKNCFDPNAPLAAPARPRQTDGSGKITQSGFGEPFLVTELSLPEGWTVVRSYCLCPICSVDRGEDV